MVTKRKKSSLAETTINGDSIIIQSPPTLPSKQISEPASGKAALHRARRPSRRGKVDTNPDHKAEIFDGPEALRASPDADDRGEAYNPKKVHGRLTVKRANGMKSVNYEESDSSLSNLESYAEYSVTPPPKKVKKMPTKSSVAAKKGSDEIKIFKAEQAAKKVVTKPTKNEDDEDGSFRPDPEADDDQTAEDYDAVKRDAARPPPVNSGYLPLPWKGRLGYVSFE